MATTRIMPLHIGKGRTESRAISDIIDYVANPQKTDNGKLITGYGCDSRTADAEFLLAKRQYIAATGRVRGADDVIAYHVRQSFKPGEITPEEANRLGVEFAKRFTKGNHAFVVCTHIDKSHVHNHIIRPAHPPGGGDILPLRQKELCIGGPAVTRIAGNELAVICFLWVFHIVDDVTDCPAFCATLANMKRHDSCSCHNRRTSSHKYFCFR